MTSPRGRTTKRDPRLHGLSSDHHHALVLARSIARLAATGSADAAAARGLAERFAACEARLPGALLDAVARRAPTAPGRATRASSCHH